MAASEIALNVFFYLFAAGALGGAAAVALSRNIVRSAFALLAVLVAVAAMYAIMKADFIAAAQVLIYVGGILVLIIFAVMLTHRITDVNVSNDSAPGLAAACACFCLMFSVVLILFALPSWKSDPFEREAPMVLAGELELRQWQADGRTGLALGGATHEEKAVLEVRAPRGREGSIVEFRIDGVPGSGKVPLVSGVARYEAVHLPKAATAGAAPKARWSAQLLGTSGEVLAPWTSPLEFEVHKGVTLLAARGLSGRYLFAFEVVSVLLLAALVGAAFLARKEVKEA
ncbi:MAG TPA: NADH-quinone oxidoreductase subunit J [Planctomycetota bacterium]